MTDAELLDLAARVFPIAAPHLRIELLPEVPLIDAAGNLAPKLRMSVTLGGARDINDQQLVLVPAADRIAERVVPYFEIVRAQILERAPEDLLQCMPSDLFVGELLGERELAPASFARILADPRARLLITVPPERREGVVIDPALRLPPPGAAEPRARSAAQR